ncbi:MAG: prepilin-type N-terminal cleavage/methylation domain [Armatimonadetes bacterium]|jgi:prepilin-type processing-associated H-X9-DG protein|nr:prepilin-type N-terminal cleavage/methylation domain [Armatimonadota bacterium]
MRRGYSSMDFYVVIGGLLLLELLLFFPLNCARDAARSTLCRSSQKLLALAIRAYADDYDDRLPPLARVKGTHTELLPALIAPYLSTGHSAWTCPSAPPRSSGKQPYRGRPDDPLVSHGYNGVALSRNGHGLPLDRVKQPEATVAFVDADSYLATPASLVPALGGSPPVYRHDQRVIVGWLDGHASMMRREQLEQTAESESGKRLGSGIDAFPHWNLR